MHDWSSKFLNFLYKTIFNYQVYIDNLLKCPQKTSPRTVLETSRLRQKFIWFIYFKSSNVCFSFKLPNFCSNSH